MSWTLETGALEGWRWAKWVDRPQAEAWLRVIARELELSTAPEVILGYVPDPAFGPPGDYTERIARWPVSEQYAATKRLFEAVRGFALACDVFPIALAPYAARRLAGDIGEDDYHDTVIPLFTQYGIWREQVWTALLAHSALIQSVAPPGGTGEFSQPVSVTIRPRIDFTGDNGGVYTITDVPETDRGSDRYGSDEATPNAWTSIVWHEWAPGALDASGEILVAALLPLRTTWEFIRDVARIMVRGGLSKILGLTTTWVAQRNIALSRALGGTGLPATLVRAVAAVDLRRAGNGELPEGWQTVGTIVTGLAALGGPVAAAVVGAILGLVAALYMVIPVAAQHATDCWGRAQPVLEKTDYTGVLAPATPPTHALVPLPADTPPSPLGYFAPVILPRPAPKKTSPLLVAAALAAAIKVMGG